MSDLKLVKKAGVDRLWMVGPGIVRGIIHGPLPNKSNAKKIGMRRGRPIMFQGPEVVGYRERFESAVWGSLRGLEQLPEDAKLYFKVTVHQENMVRDLDCELLPDLLQRFNVIKNDRAIWHKVYTRAIDKANPRAEFEIGVWTAPGEVDLFTQKT